MKKLCSMLLAVMLLLSAAAPAMADMVNTALLPACYRYVTTGEAVMYRGNDMPVFASANASSAVIGRVRAGERVEVVTLSTYRDWAYIVSSSMPGGAWIPANTLISASVLSNNAVVVAGGPGRRVNLRQFPDSSSATMGKYYTGTLVTVLSEQPVANDYYLVRIGSMEGYMSGSYLKRSLTNTWVELPTLIAGSWTATQHPLHAQPNGAAQVVGYVPNSASVTVLGIRNDGWYHVVYQGMTGYIRTSALLQTLPWDLDTVDTSTSATSQSDPAAYMINNLLNSDNSVFVLSSAPNRRVNLRTRPDGSAPVLIKYYTGTPMYVIDGGENGYLHVRIGYLEGYMDMRFIAGNPDSRSTDMHGSTVAAPAGYGYVQKWNEVGSEITAALPNDTTVVVLGWSDSWAHIVYGNMQHGFMLRTDLYPEP